MIVEKRAASAKIAITVDASLLQRLDLLVAGQHFPNRSKAIQEAIREKLDRLDQSRLARETAKLDPSEERMLADEGLDGGREEWPEY